MDEEKKYVMDKVNIELQSLIDNGTIDIDSMDELALTYRMAMMKSIIELCIEKKVFSRTEYADKLMKCLGETAESMSFANKLREGL